MVLEALTLTGVPHNVYSGHFTPDNFGNSEMAIKELSATFQELSPDILAQIIPSLHRVQKIFGNQAFLPANRLAENTKFDLKSFCQMPDEVVNQVDQVIRSLGIAEMILTQHFIDESPLSKKRGTDAIEDIDTRTAIVTTIIWEHWKPWESQPDVGLVDSLIKHVLGNLAYGDLTTARKNIKRNETDFTFQDDVAGDEKLGRTWSWMAAEDSEQRRLAPSAEKVYLENEAETEFLQLAKGTPIQEIILGETIESYAAKHSMSVSFARKRLQEALLRISQAGVSQFQWGRSVLDRLQANVLPKQNYETSQELPTNYELWSMFADHQTNLSQLMGIIDTLPPIQKKCILYRFGYLNPEVTNTENWVRANDMSEKLYRTTLHKAFETIQNHLNKPFTFRKSIADLVTETSFFSVEQNSKGRKVDETSNRFLRLITRQRQGSFPDGSLTSKERDIVATISSIYETLQRVPTIPELTQALGLKYTEVIGQINNLLRYDFSQPRFATKDFQIRFDSDWFKLIKWTRENLAKPEVMMDLSALTPLQLSVYRLCCQPVDGYFLTHTQIYEILVKQGIKISDPMAMFHFFTAARKTLESKPEINRIYVYLKSQDLQNPTLGPARAKKEILERIERGEAIGKGCQGLIAEKLGVSEGTVNTAFRELRITFEE